MNFDLVLKLYVYGAYLLIQSRKNSGKEHFTVYFYNFYYYLIPPHMLASHIKPNEIVL